MTRSHKVGSITDVVARAIEATGKAHRDVAEDLGIRASTLSYGMEVSEDRPGGLGIAYLHRLALAEPACAVPVAGHFAMLAGGVFQPVNLGVNDANLYSHCCTIAKECGEASAATIRAAEMSTVNALDDAERELMEAQEAIARGLAEVRRRKAVA